MSLPFWWPVVVKFADGSVTVVATASLTMEEALRDARLQAQHRFPDRTISCYATAPTPDAAAAVKITERPNSLLARLYEPVRAPIRKLLLKCSL